MDIIWHTYHSLSQECDFLSGFILGYTKTKFPTMVYILVALIDISVCLFVFEPNLVLLSAYSWFCSQGYQAQKTMYDAMDQTSDGYVQGKCFFFFINYAIALMDFYFYFLNFGHICLAQGSLFMVFRGSFMVLGSNPVWLWKFCAISLTLLHLT